MKNIPYQKFTDCRAFGGTSTDAYYSLLAKFGLSDCNRKRSNKIKECPEGYLRVARGGTTKFKKTEPLLIGSRDI